MIELEDTINAFLNITLVCLQQNSTGRLINHFRQTIPQKYIFYLNVFAIPAPLVVSVGFAWRLHNKSHCVFSFFLRLDTDWGDGWCFSFFLFISCVWKCMNNMLMCALDLSTAKRSLQLMHHCVQNIIFILFICSYFLSASTYVYESKRERQKERETRKELHHLRKSILFTIIQMYWGYSLFDIMHNNVCLWSYWRAMFYFLYSWWSPRALCNRVTKHSSSYMFIIRISVHSGGPAGWFISVLQDPGRTRHHLFRQSNPLNPLECFALLATPVEGEKLLYCWSTGGRDNPGWSRRGWFIIIWRWIFTRVGNRGQGQWIKWDLWFVKCQSDPGVEPNRVLIRVCKYHGASGACSRAINTNAVHASARTPGWKH